MRHRVGISAIILMGFLLGSLGFLPSPVLVARFFGRELGERFPCEADACGCVSARECWTHCCCFSPAERLAWAAWAGVKPPAYVLQDRECMESQESCCASDEPPAIEDQGDRASDSSVSPVLRLHTRFQCKNTSLWLVMSVPVAPVSGSRAMLFDLDFREFMPPALPVSRLGSRVRDVPTPPPQVHVLRA